MSRTQQLAAACVLVSSLCTVQPAHACLWWLMPGWYGMAPGWNANCAPGGYAVPAATPYYAGYGFGPRLISPVWNANPCCIPQACNPCQSACDTGNLNPKSGNSLKPRIDESFAEPATNQIELPSYDTAPGEPLQPVQPVDTKPDPAFDDTNSPGIDTFDPADPTPAFDPQTDFPPIEDQPAISNKPPLPELLDEVSPPAAVEAPQPLAPDESTEADADETQDSSARLRMQTVPFSRSRLDEVISTTRLPHHRDRPARAAAVSRPVRWISVPMPANTRRL
ncbi:MAG: hypothetical protein ACPGXX_09955 [Planctomycetaceae bacterium]